MPKAFARRLTDVSSELKSLDDTAALIETLDLVVTVDTAVAHLAGALGKPVWLLLHDFADCRWTLTDAASYWYRDVRLIRQPEPGDWAGVIDAVKLGLQALTPGR
jgi:ADP-heptose:LPS heptosyltransferase